jgi:hypothetical protein
MCGADRFFRVRAVVASRNEARSAAGNHRRLHGSPRNSKHVEWLVELRGFEPLTSPVSGNGRELFCEGRYDRPGCGRGDRAMDHFAGLDISMDETERYRLNLAFFCSARQAC